MSARAAKVVVVILILGLMSISFLSWFPEPADSDIMRTTASGFLCWFLYLGHSWVRIWLGLTSLVGGFFGTVFLSDASTTIGEMIVMTPITVFYFTTAFLLLYKKILRNHFSEDDARGS